MATSLAKRLLKNSTLEDTDLLESSTFLTSVDETTTPVPMMNVAFSGKLDGGFKSGVTIYGGPSKHFKSCYGLLMTKSYLDKHDDAVCLFYDSEFGSMPDYFENFGIDTSRVIHTPIENVEELKFDITKQLDEITKEDRVIIFIDSLGNLASKKEVDDAMDQKSVADMTRAKQMKSLFRIITPMLVKRDIPLVGIAHTYNTLEIYSKAVIGGGTGIMYSANSCFIVGKRQVKDGKELEGYEFILNTEKSRTIKEKSVIPITVKFNEGVDIYSGLLEVAIQTGHVVAPKQGWYNRPGFDAVDKNWRKKKTNCAEFWDPLLADDSFKTSVTKLYSLEGSSMFSEEDIIDFDPETGEILEEKK